MLERGMGLLSNASSSGIRPAIPVETHITAEPDSREDSFRVFRDDERRFHLANRACDFRADSRLVFNAEPSVGNEERLTPEAVVVRSTTPRHNYAHVMFSLTFQRLR